MSMDSDMGMGVGMDMMASTVSDMGGGGRRRALTPYQKFMSKNLKELRRKAERAGKKPKQTDLMSKAAALWRAKKKAPATKKKKPRARK